MLCSMRSYKGGIKMDNRAMIQQGLDYIEENLRAEITYKF